MFIVLCLAAVLAASASAACTRSVSCPCGTSNTNSTFCTDDLALEGHNPCARWSQCKTCEEGVSVCITCPSGRSGALCTTVSDNGGPSSMQIGSCPPLKSPVPGTISCKKYDNFGDCTGRCVPGYTFEGNADKTEMTLYCRNDSWHPLPYYPACKHNNFCELVSQDISKFNCSIGVHGTQCDIECHYRYQGRFYCYPGRSWKPTLPYCVVAKESTSSYTPPCRCEKGGNCDKYGFCRCHRGWTGKFCEHAESVTCPDPGFLIEGDRTNADGTLASYPRNYKEKELVVYSCKSKEMVLVGKPFIICTANGTWSASLPKCVRSPGCSLDEEQEFLDELVQSFSKEMQENAKNRSITIETPTPEEAVRWKFFSIDENTNSVLDKREWKIFKKEWRNFQKDSKQKKRLRTCWRNLPRFCDVNDDQKITMDEWLACTGAMRDIKEALPRNQQRNGKNPFNTVIVL